MLSKRRLAATVIAVTATAALVSAGPSYAGAHPAPSVHFTSPFKDRGTNPDSVHSCSPGQTGVCEFRFHGSADFTGKLSAFDDYFGYFWVNPEAHQAEAETWDRTTGALNGCGEGSFVLHQHAFGPTGYNTTGEGAGPGFKLHLTWEILRGSGTGDFTGATGSGTGDGDFTPTLANTGTYTGTITCPNGKPSYRHH
ncbi:MAG: hypothetical protein QOK42_875 [Frankiaceae bacterium]|nr:hypothetical protein [Frankiaceae bacterium]